MYEPGIKNRIRRYIQINPRSWQQYVPIRRGRNRSAKEDIISAYDYKKLAAALAPNDLRYIDELEYTPVGNILLTGSHGILGTHVLKNF